MISIGIDLSSMPAGTALCSVLWQGDRASVIRAELGCGDDALDGAIAEAQSAGDYAVGIDAPLGWPQPFAAAVGKWSLEHWDPTARDRLRFRRTDLWVREHFDLQPLSVSSDLIALPAMRAMALLHRHGVTDRSGAGDWPFFEVYPAGSLAQWDLPSRGYKKAGDPAPRRHLLREIQRHLPSLELGDEAPFLQSADVLDALIASLAVRAAWQGHSHRPAAADRELAAQEGWIHLPKAWPTP